MGLSGRPVRIELALVEKPYLDERGKRSGVRCEVVHSFASEEARNAVNRSPALRRRIEEAVAAASAAFKGATWTARTRRDIARLVESDLRSDYDWNDAFDFRCAPSLVS